MRKWFSVIGLSLFSIGIVANAQEEAHEHGLAKVMLVSEADLVSLQFESPAMNLVGFEHEPSSKAQHKALEQALGKLNKPESLISFNGGQCRFISTELNSPFDSSHNDNKGNKKDEHKHDQHKHDENKHKHDEHKHGHTGHEVSEHRDFLVEYQARCQKIDELKAIDFTILNIFKGIEELDVQYIFSGEQGASTLTGKRSRLNIQP